MANFKKDKKHHFLYKTTNIINGRYYVGMHSTNNLKDGYLGSGKRLRYEIRKYGRINFKVEIIKRYDTREQLILAEKLLINQECLTDENCLNLKPGGSGGLMNDDHKIKWQSAGNPAAVKKLKWLWEHDEEFKLKNTIKNGLRNPTCKGCKNWWIGKKHKEETKQKIGKANSIKQLGTNNSQYGTRWITNGEINKKIKKDVPIPLNWKLGRTL